MRICVVGGGTAGREAAAEAAVRGAEVTLVERSAVPQVPWKRWPDLIVTPGAAEPPRPAWFAGRWKMVEPLLSLATRSGPGYVDTDAGRVRSDSTILATGSRFRPPAIQGYRKPGVMTLDSPGSYEELGRMSAQTSRIIVTGEGVRCLEVAERLCGGGRALFVIISGWQEEAPSTVVLDVLSDAASERGVTIRHGTVTRALGATELEAALTDGSVVKCDALVLVPRRVPNVISTCAPLGPAGGVLVGRSLRTGVPSTLAVGGCAELEGMVPPRTFGEEPSLSGRVAASNCMGSDLRLSPRSLREVILFGLRWTRWDQEETGGRLEREHPRLRKRWSKTSACDILFESLSRRILRIETVEEASSRSIGLGPLPTRTSLASLAYGRFGSSDISLVSDTARLALEEWQRC